MTTPMTPERLAEIKTRRFWGGAVKPYQVNVEAVLKDFDELLAEVDRLREFELFMRKQAADYGPSASLAASLAEWDGTVS